MTKLLIEVGGYDGLDSLRYHANGYNVYTFEPNHVNFKDLKKRTESLSNYTVINKAVCLTDGTTIFNICRSGGASSILPFKNDYELMKHWGRDDVMYSGTSYTVPTIRLDTFIEEYNLQNETIDMLHIDAQGVDLDVLKSLGKYIKNVKEGVVECAISSEKAIYVNQSSLMMDVQKWLTEHDFQITNITSNDTSQCEYNIFFKSCIDNDS